MKKKVRKELIEWIVLITVIGLIYVGGWHTEVIGRIQQMVLATGIIEPDLATGINEASYDFWLEDKDGNEVAFSEFEGEVVFMNFWATWCPPCVAEMPDIHSLYLSQQNQIKFVIISLDQDRQKAVEFITRKKFTFPVYFLQSSLPPTYDTRSIPTTYVIDRNGFIQVENHGMAKYNTRDFKKLLETLFESK